MDYFVVAETIHSEMLDSSTPSEHVPAPLPIDNDNPTAPHWHHLAPPLSTPLAATRKSPFGMQLLHLSKDKVLNRVEGQFSEVLPGISECL